MTPRRRIHPHVENDGTRPLPRERGRQLLARPDHFPRGAECPAEGREVDLLGGALSGDIYLRINTTGKAVDQTVTINTASGPKTTDAVIRRKAPCSSGQVRVR